MFRLRRLPTDEICESLREQIIVSEVEAELFQLIKNATLPTPTIRAKSSFSCH